MRAAVIHGSGDVRFEQRPDPELRQPTDALVRVVAACVCGSDLWPYRGVRPIKEPKPIGHEFVGVVEQTGADVRSVKAGDFVIAPFAISDGTCAHCRNGVHTSCERVEWWGGTDGDGHTIDGGQGEYVRVPLADGTLVATPEVPDPALDPLRRDGHRTPRGPGRSGRSRPYRRGGR
jgi:threonine dehydrogenase-like Zn-dependent dehydrogenase